MIESGVHGWNTTSNTGECFAYPAARGISFKERADDISGRLISAHVLVGRYDSDSGFRRGWKVPEIFFNELSYDAGDTDGVRPTSWLTVWLVGRHENYSVEPADILPDV